VFSVLHFVLLPVQIHVKTVVPGLVTIIIVRIYAVIPVPVDVPEPVLQGVQSFAKLIVLKTAGIVAMHLVQQVVLMAVQQLVLAQME